jgi:regulator of replication initiation timing
MESASLPARLAGLKEQVDRMVLKMKEKELEYEHLKTRNHELELQLKQQEEYHKHNQPQPEKDKLAVFIENSDEIKGIKSQISELIKEIDENLALIDNR